MRSMCADKGCEEGMVVANVLSRDGDSSLSRHPKSLQDFYTDKTGNYFEGLRADILEALPLNGEARILEIGCGLGSTGEIALASGRAGHYFGVELDEKAAATAAKRLTRVHRGNVEQMDLDLLGTDYDVLIMSEVLEHLVDPWGVLAALIPRIRPGGCVYASSPNISHQGVVRALLSGRFDYQPSGVMDRTHLRWFTPATFAEMFEKAGFRTLSVGPLSPIGRKAAVINALTAGRFSHLFAVQIMYKGMRPEHV